MDKKSGRFRKKRTSFAQVSNVALRDPNLSLKAKGLLALVESYLSLDGFVLYKDFLISKSKDGETAFRGAWKELKDNGYLIQYKMKDEVTSRFYYEYEICDNPQVENQHVESGPLEVCEPHVENPLVETPHHSSSTSSKLPLYNNTLLNNTLCINTIHTNIDYDPVFVNSNDKELVDNIVDIMVDVLSNNYDSIKINNGEVKIEVLRSVLLKVNMNHIIYTIDIINKYGGKINNMRNFILSVLYNSVLTLDSYYQNLINTKGS
jgi:hypothetical protein